VVLILTYHSIDPSGSVISTSPAQFRRQMMQLRKSGFKVLSVSELARLLHAKADLPPKAAAITYDDGYRNIYEHAFPVLQEYGFPATVFLVAGRCGERSQWDGRRSQALDILNWSQVKEMARHNVEFGSHSMTHADLSRLPADAAREEILGSNHLIEQALGRPARLFAWPYGRTHPGLLDEVREWFSAVCTVMMNPVTDGCDPFALPRIDMYYFSRNDRLSQLGERRFVHYVWLRKQVRAFGNVLRRDSQPVS